MKLIKKFRNGTALDRMNKIPPRKFDFENFILQFANPKIRSFEKSNNAYTDSFRIYSSPKTTKTNHQYILMTLKNVEIKTLYEDVKGLSIE